MDAGNAWALLASAAAALGAAIWVGPTHVLRSRAKGARLVGAGSAPTGPPVGAPPLPEAMWSSVPGAFADSGGIQGVGHSWPRRIPRPGRARAPDIVGLLASLSAELQAGQPPDVALEQACLGFDPDPCPQARAAARLGGDVAQGLRGDARVSGGSGLGALAACWQVAGRSGSGLSASVRRLADAERASKAARGELLAELATVRASARLLAGLPLFGLLLGVGLDADPLGWLSGTGLGRLALLGGLILEGAGLLWLHRIVARVRAAIP